MSVFQRHPGLTLGFTILALLLPLDLVTARMFIEQSPGEYSPFYHHGLKKHFKGVTGWGPLRIRMFTNSLGFKDKLTRDVPLAPNRRRIVFIGDSFTEGVGIAYEETFVGRIDAAVGSNTCEVLNAGFKSGFPKLYFLRLKQLVDRGFRFDELNVFIDISDIKDEVSLEDFEPHDPTPRERIAEIGRYLSDRSLIYSLLLQPLASKVIHLAGATTTVDGRASPQMEEDKDKWTFDDAVYRDWGTKGLALAGEHMKNLAALCRSVHASLTVAVYPWPAQILHRDRESRQVEYWKTFADREHVPFVNYFPDFTGPDAAQEIVRRYFIPGDFHWNPDGHGLIARKWLDEVDRSLAAECGRVGQAPR